jgi:hypothetical protein
MGSYQTSERSRIKSLDTTTRQVRERLARGVHHFGKEFYNFERDFNLLTN